MGSLFPYRKQDLDEKRRLGDFPADEFVNACFADELKKRMLYDWLASKGDNRSLNALPEVFMGESIFMQARVLPAWAQPALIEKGSVFFERNANQIMQLLGLLSLPYCYAAADGAMVLYISERLRKDTGKRLEETGEFVVSVQSANAFEEGGKAFISILKTRLIHAIARYYTLKSGRWDGQWGHPVNQEDMAGTQLAFSLMVIRGLRKLGTTISDRDQQAFLHLWAVIAFLLGQDEALIPRNGKEANYLEQLIRKRNFRPSEQGKTLTASLIESFQQLQPEANITGRELKEMMLFFLGEEIGQCIGLEDVRVPAHIPLLLKSYSAMNRLGQLLK
ncbi:oxygenase MpaB family protein [Pedobacter sp. SYSU D00535]|uniref:oxygenase MpaB family protein n=1 Tax=Pedobacter sp. SYSU D00535 TaxID=2810308 RepID=UPI001A972D2D|nr:oxygenase MpaB family protein [Pedobacter sp. SYSU D00535]